VSRPYAAGGEGGEGNSVSADADLLDVIALFDRIKEILELQSFCRAHGQNNYSAFCALIGAVPP
jgi:hypothetical protein